MQIWIIFTAQQFSMSYIIAVDIGTTNCKLVTVDDKGKTVNSFKETLRSIQPNEGWHEQDAELIFQTVLRLLQQSLSSLQHEEIACISFSAAMHSMLAIDKNGIPITNAITWADTRSKTYARQLRNAETGKNIYRQTGTPVHAMSPLCKLIFLKNEKPQLLAEAHKFVSIKEYIFYRLFGKFIVDTGIASATGIYDTYNSCWCKEAMDVAGIDESKLSDVVSATHIETAVTPYAKKKLGLKKSIPFVIGGNDGCLANLGCGALNPNEAALTIGTSGAVRVTIPKPATENLSGLFRYLLTEDLYVTGAAINNGGIALQWFADNFLQIKISSNEDLNGVLKIAEQAPVGDKGLIFLPYLLGERGTIWDEEASAMFYGLRANHKKEHLTRVVIEGISFSLLQILKAIEKSNIGIDKIFVSGIVTKSEWWMQLLANVFGKTIVLSDDSDASAMGAAFMGMYATGIIKDLSEVKSFIKTTKTFEADELVHQLYQQQYKVYASLYPTLPKTWK
jgi:gluconokinase